MDAAVTLYSTRYLQRRRWAALILAAIVGFLAVVTSAVSWTIDSLSPRVETVSVEASAESSEILEAH